MSHLNISKIILFYYFWVVLKQTEGNDTESLEVSLHVLSPVALASGCRPSQPLKGSSEASAAEGLGFRVWGLGFRV